MNGKQPKPVMKDATVLLLDDPTIGGQCLLAISRDGAWFLPSNMPVRAIELPELKKFFTEKGALYGEEVTRVALAEIAARETS